MPKTTLDVNNYLWFLRAVQNLGDPLVFDYGLN